MYETPRTTILYFQGSEKLKDVFSFANESAAQSSNYEYSYSLSGKIYFENIVTKQESYAYIVDEEDTNISLLHLDNSIETIKKDFHYVHNKQELYADPKIGNEKIGYHINEIDYNPVTTNKSNKNLQPSYYLGSTATRKIIWVEPVRIIIYKNAMINFRIFSNFYVKRLTKTSSELDVNKSSCKLFF